MMTAEATLPVMRNSDVAMHEFPDHANVLAVVHAYTEAAGPMPYQLLLDVMESFGATGNDMAIQHAGGVGVARGLHQILADLRRLDLIDMGSAGTELTPCGYSRLQGWNGLFRQRRTLARDAMTTMGFLRA